MDRQKGVILSGHVKATGSSACPPQGQAALTTRRSSWRNTTGLCLWSLLLAIVVGCGGSTGPTSGVVKFADGSPVQTGSIELRRTSDGRRFSSRIATDGTFQPANQYGEIGLPPGKYEAVIVQIVLTEDLALEAHSHGGTVPRRYADYYTSGLRVQVSEGQVEPIVVEVQAR